MFEITVRKRFSARHALRNYRGSDEELHAHEWICEVSIFAIGLDASGCAVDFARVDEALSAAIAPFDGRSMNDCAVFSGMSPSAENVARYIHAAISKALKGSVMRVMRATVWEDENHSAAYFENRP